MLTPERLALYRQIMHNLTQGNFQVELPEQVCSPELGAFEQELQQLADWLSIQFNEFNQLQAITAEILKGNLLEDVLSRIYNAFQPCIPYDRIGCALLSDDQQQVQAYWARTNYQDHVLLVQGYTSPLTGSSLEAILQTRQPRIINDLTQHLQQHPDSQATELLLQEGIRSSLTCPLIAEGQPVGFLFFSSRQPDTYHSLHQKLFINIANQVSLVIEKSRLYQHILDLNQQLSTALTQLKEQSSRDALTGLLHRGAIMERLTESLAEAHRHDRPLAVLMADIDHFKQINDCHGHLQGDAVLKAVSQTLQESLRLYDKVGRYGGEEFLVVLRDSDQAEAAVVAERIRQAVADLSRPELAVSISLGLACWQGEESLESLLSRADSALYRAKAAGRNRVEAAT